MHGNLNGFDCSSLAANGPVKAINLSQAPNLIGLYCYDNQLTTLNVSGLTNLEYLNCYGNKFSTQALNDIYCALPTRPGNDRGFILPAYDNSDPNYAAIAAAYAKNAKDKNWNVVYDSNNAAMPDGNAYTCPGSGYTVTYTQPANGSLIVKKGSAIVASGSNVASGTVLTITATPNAGYVLDKITINSTDYNTSPQNYTVTSNTTISAAFNPATVNYTVTYAQSANGSLIVENGSAIVASGSSVASGTILTITATPNSNFVLEKIVINNVDYATSPIDIEVSSDINISAIFKPGDGIVEIIDKGITISPNPTCDYVKIDSKNKIETIEVFGIVGNNLLTTKHINEKTFKLDLLNFAEGAYILKIKTSKGLSINKIVKIK